jgi:hypothetical protein
MSRIGNGNFVKLVSAHKAFLSPERKLWRAVLEQLYADAETPPETGRKEDAMQRTLARRFLRAAGSLEAASLRAICECADVPFDRVVLWARKQYPSHLDDPLPDDANEILNAADAVDDLLLECELGFQAPETGASN